MTFQRNTYRIFFIILWLVLFGALLKRDYFISSIDINEEQIIKRSREESFAGIYFQNERIGFVKNRLTESGSDAYILYQDAFLYLNILNESYPIDMRIEATLGLDMRLDRKSVV